MNDAELLMLAAKAIGIDIEIKCDVEGRQYAWRGNPIWDKWNPLGDDGDAMRIAVHLRLLVGATDKNEAWVQFYRGGNKLDGYATVKESHGSDPYAAARRAIVRAAAEIAIHNGNK